MYVFKTSTKSEGVGIQSEKTVHVFTTHFHKQLLVIVCRTKSITSTCFSYMLLLRLQRSVRLPEMYEHNVQQNEQPQSMFFIITHTMIMN